MQKQNKAKKDERLKVYQINKAIGLVQHRHTQKTEKKKNKSITKILVSPVKEQEATIQPSYCGPRENYSQRFQRI